MSKPTLEQIVEALRPHAKKPLSGGISVGQTGKRPFVSMAQEDGQSYLCKDMKPSEALTLAARILATCVPLLKGRKG